MKIDINVNPTEFRFWRPLNGPFNELLVFFNKFQPFRLLEKLLFPVLFKHRWIFANNFIKKLIEIR
jgi:hypothetical protein